MVRIEPTPITRPNVGEVSTVSIEVYWGLFNTFDACQRTSRFRVSPRLKSLLSAMFSTADPGPMMEFRPASPYVPGAGAVNAAVLNHSPSVGLANEIGSPV